jgi:hypothetical protein
MIAHDDPAVVICQAELVWSLLLGTLNNLDSSSIYVHH